MARAWELPGGEHEPDSPGLAYALRNWHTAERRKPTPEDAPAVSTLPMTKAARAALELSRARGLPPELRGERPSPATPTRTSTSPGTRPRAAAHTPAPAGGRGGGRGER